MTAIAVVLGIITTLVAVLIQWLPESAGEEMDRIIFTYWFATVICIVIFAVVGAVILYSVFAFRAQPEDDTDGPPIHGHTGLEIVWTVIPAVLVVAIGVVSAVVLAKNGDAGTNPNRVNVTGQQFAWRFEYEDGKVRAGILKLPINRTTVLEIHAVDVIHSFWVPELGQKSDAVPGILTTLNVTPTRLGTFPVICTELCGLGHATMRATAEVVSQADYDAWLDEQQSGGGGGGGGEGEALFASEGCGGCHAFEPAGSTAEIGPSLDGIGDHGEDFIRQSIVDPEAEIAAGYQPGIMPTTYGGSLSEEQLDALVSFLGGES